MADRNFPLYVRSVIQGMAEIPDDFSFQDPIQRPGCSEGKPMQVGENIDC